MRIRRRCELLLGGVPHRLSPQLRRPPAPRLGATGHKADAVHLVRHVGHMTAVEAGRLDRTRNRLEGRLGHRLHAGERIGTGAPRRIATRRLREHGERAVSGHGPVRIRRDLDRFTTGLVEANGPRVALSARARRREEQVFTVGRPAGIAALGIRRRPPLRLAAGGVHHPDLAMSLIVGLDGLGHGHRHALAVRRDGWRAHIDHAIPIGQHHRARARGGFGHGWRLLRHHRGGGGDGEGGQRSRMTKRGATGGRSDHGGARGGKSVESRAGRCTRKVPIRDRRCTLGLPWSALYPRMTAARRSDRAKNRASPVSKRPGTHP